MRCSYWFAKLQDNQSVHFYSLQLAQARDSGRLVNGQFKKPMFLEQMKNKKYVDQECISVRNNGCFSYILEHAGLHRCQGADKGLTQCNRKRGNSLFFFFFLPIYYLCLPWNWNLLAERKCAQCDSSRFWLCNAHAVNKSLQLKTLLKKSYDTVKQTWRHWSRLWGCILWNNYLSGAVGGGRALADSQ